LAQYLKYTPKSTIVYIEKKLYMLLSLIFLTSLLMAAFSIPSIINLAFKKRLFDNPSEIRKVHKRIVPNFGGIAIFTSFLFSCSLFIKSDLVPESSVLMAGGLILFMTGLKDDIIGLGPAVKLVAQIISGTIIAVVANIRIDDLHGFLGVGKLDYYPSIILTTIFIVSIVNAFNLIDGIDGLAASLGVTLSLIYTYLFWSAGEIGWSYLSIALTGSLIGFMFFNVTPAKIFMGDCGSLLLGFIAVVLSIKFMDFSAHHDVVFGSVKIESSMALTLSILIIPIFDTIRVFTLRVLKNTSPFKADNNHLHHRLLFLGLSHMQSTLVLVVTNVLFILMALTLQNLDNTQLISVLVLTVLMLNGGLSLYIESFRRSLLAKANAPEKPVVKSFGEEVLEKITEN
jgi:UDP-GlcNAc:undecaprenyl-phosphate/decaprenyl-phosphate GlcNAc-1-phosphate transferase